MKILSFSLKLGQDLDAYIKKHYPWVRDYRVISESLDARHANKGRAPLFLYQIEALEQDQKFPEERTDFPHVSHAKSERPIIIGMGPAGLFAALRLVEYGLRPIVLERGGPAGSRMLKIARYWRYGELDENNNVCFGEGGAGLFSDGKLITRIKSEHIKYVMKRFVDFGAPAETAYTSNPHLGSNKIRGIISHITRYLCEKGVDLRYHAQVTELIFDGKKQVRGVKLKNGEDILGQQVILAIGHSADEFYQHLDEQGVALAQKDFAVGCRIEHPREYLDRLQYGDFCGNLQLGASRYRLSSHDRESGRGTYSFCMCPGGIVLSSGTHPDGLVVNGMSNYSRNSPWSNAAIVVSVKSPGDFQTSGKNQVMAGLQFQRQIEQRALQVSKSLATGKEIPAMTVGEFFSGKLNQRPLPNSSNPSKNIKASFDEIFPSFILEHLKNGLEDFDRQLKGFAYENALLMAPETRTSSPLTILRDREQMQSLSHPGLYPCGEGAGYAGGITSAAVDGIKCAEAIIHSLTKS